jgi:transposase
VIPRQWKVIQTVREKFTCNRQSETYAREDIHLDVSTMADWVGACTAALAPLVTLIRAHAGRCADPR